MMIKLASIALITSLSCISIASNASSNLLEDAGSKKDNRNVIFFHPDGYSFNHWNALRIYTKGADGRLNWDKLPHMATYTGHLKDSLTSSSHGGATVHAYGVKVARNSFGLDRHSQITSLSGKKLSIMQEAMQAGYATALVQSGSIVEPGTAAFVASVKERNMKAEIAKQVINSGVDVILSGGEQWLLPKGTKGFHGEGKREDGVNLINQAKQLGYTVVYTRKQLMNLPNNTTKLLGVFASKHTFNDKTEEKLRQHNLPLYVEGSPTIAEMSKVSLEVLARNPKTKNKGMFIVAEEEGTDNFGNKTNAKGSFEAGKRADETFGVFIDFINNHPNTLLITAADSSAGGKHVLASDSEGMKNYVVEGVVTTERLNSGTDGKYVKVPVDGVDGANSAPFLSAPDKAGNQYPFVITWASKNDLSGGIVARAKGLNADKVSSLGIVDNTDIYRIIYDTLFDKWLPKP